MDSVQTPPQQQDQSQPSPLAVPGAVLHGPVNRDRIRELSLTFGHIPDVQIFTEWETRKQCSDTGVHRSIMAGICGNKRYGAYSIALSGKYEDDEDGGDVIIYTGSGGRKKWSDGVPPKRLMFGPQTADQSWDDTRNGALLVSCSTGEPIRVIRSSKLPSKYAPLRGYRYDGLYTITSCWTAMGKKGFRICRCRLQRVPGQPPIPERPFTIRASKRRRRTPPHRYSPFTSSRPSKPTNIPSQTGANDGPVQSSPAPAQNILGESTESPRPPPEHAMSEILTLLEHELNNMNHEDSPLPQVSAIPDAPLYERDANNDMEITNEGEDEHRVDDVTLVPSEDERTDVPEVGYGSDVQM